MRTRLSIILVSAAAAVAFVLGMVLTPEAGAQSGGEIVLSDTAVITATIVAIDKKDRTVTLLGSRGQVTTFEVGARMSGFDELEVGDHVKVEYCESVALYLGAHGTQPDADAALVVARTPGDANGSVAVGAVDVSAQVSDIDRAGGTLTLTGHDGRSVTARIDERTKGLDNVHVGDLIHARFTEAIAISIEPAVPEDLAKEVSLLFVQSSRGVSYDAAAGTLTLDGVSPVVPFFSDRPYRIAGHILLPAFLKVWNEGGDSFKNDPPNASLSILEDGQVRSAVIEIANPRLENDQLTYQVLRVLEGDLPASGSVNSLFIDGLFDGGAVGGGLKGAAGGALIGAISGNAGKGAAIGAGIGIVGGAIRKGREEQAQAETQATTRVINVPNANGSFTPVSLHLVSTGWRGPRGEIYPTLPTVGQLQGVYGVR